jgi:hypothetical protein
LLTATRQSPPAQNQKTEHEGKTARHEMALPVRSEKREDKLPLERALRALEDARTSLKKFSATDSVAENDSLKAQLKIVRRKAGKLRKRAMALGSLWDQDAEGSS